MNAKLNVFLFKKPNEIIEAAKIALKNKLYVSGWQLSRWLQDAKFHPTRFQAIVLAFRNEVPIAVLVSYKDQTSGVFVRKIERRQGIATKLVDAVCQSGFIPIFTAHDQRSLEFFEGVEANIELEYDMIVSSYDDEEDEDI